MDLNIDAPLLARALIQLTEQTGLRLIFPAADHVAELPAQRLSGTYTPQAALDQLLKGSGLQYEFIDSHTVAIRAIKAEPAKSKRVANASESNMLAVPSVQLAQADQGGASSGSSAQEQPSPEQSARLEEVVVTASRRRQTLEEVPYSITAVSAEQIANSGVTDISSLTHQVPGLSMVNVSAAQAVATFPIIRGLNASAGGAIGHTLNQPPVGTYIGNSPVLGYFQLDDIQRVEVLRGPQGTLYGAGALGGALRIIPNSPQLGQFQANIEAGGGNVSHSSDESYTTRAMVNVPIGDTLAFRASGKYAYEPGYIDIYGLVKRTGSLLTGAPVLADPTDPVNSPAVYSGKRDYNDQNTFTGRASLRWQPISAFNAEASFLFSNLNGFGGPSDNPDYKGGLYPGDPRITFPTGGEYKEFGSIVAPYERRTALSSLDLSYDMGFATLSSTSSYLNTSGANISSTTYGILALPGFLPYYAGTPTNPRYLGMSEFPDSEHTFSQEVRLVSNTSADNLFDYTVGLYYENQGLDGHWLIAQPGSPERSIAQGCTGRSSVAQPFRTAW